MMLFSTIISALMLIAGIANAQRPSSEGIEFWTAFIPNKGGAPLTNASLTIINANNVPSIVNITYKDLSTFTVPPDIINVSLIVQSGAMQTLALPSTAVDGNPTVPGINPIPPASVYITATQSVSIIATSMSADGTTGDSFLVLPTSLLQNNYVVAGRMQINPQQPKNFHTVYIIATQDNTDVIAVDPQQGEPSIGTLAAAGDVLKFASINAYIVAVNSSKPVALVAGSNCFAYSDGQCDHQAYMPFPVPDSCSNPGDYLYLLGSLNGNNNNYFVGSTYGSTCNIEYHYDSMSPSRGGSGRLLPNEPVQFFNTSISPEQNSQDSHTVSTDINPLIITLIGQSSSFQGAYLVAVPSVAQFVTGTVLFATFGSLNIVQVIADSAAEQSALLDDEPAGFWLPYANVDGYYFAHLIIIDNSKPHKFSANGKFMITVYGQSLTGDTTYAYLPAVNAPVYESTSTPSTSTASTSTLSASSGSTLAPSSPSATEGVEFWTTFIPNRDGSQNTNASTTFLNKNKQTVTVNITYFDSSAFPTTMTSVQVTVQAASTITYFFPTTALDPEDNLNSLNRIPGASIYITSTQPISVVASSYLLDGSRGDRYLVLPTSLLQSNYVVAGKLQAPVGSSSSRQIAYIIVTQDNTDFTATLLGTTPSTNLPFTEVGAAVGTVFKFASVNRYTLVVSSTKPIAMVVGANCFMYRSGACDHQAHMPLPVPPSCTYPGTDLHLFNNVNDNINDYFVASTFGCNIPFVYDTNLPSGGGGGRLTENQPVIETDFLGPNLEDTHIVTSDINPLLITQIGNAGIGSYLVYVPAVEQFVTGTVMFAAFDDNSQLQVIANRNTESNGAIMDGQNFPGTWMPFPGANSYFIANINLTQGLHSFSSTGYFLLTVYGFAQMSAYAYLPAMNAPVHVQTQSTTAVSSSSSSSSPIASSSTQQSSTVASTSASSSSSTTTTTITAQSSVIDSEGSDFWTAFILNKTPGRTNTNASLTFINRNVFSVNVNITYNNVTASTKITDFTTVLGMSTLTRYFPQDSLDVTNYAVEDGFDFVLPSSFRVQSSAPISVVATSTSLDGSSGDSYLVLPTTLLQTTYVVAGADQVAPTNYNSRNVVYFIATQDNTEFYATILKNGTFYTGYQALNAGGMCAFVSANAYTVVMTTTKPVAVVVGADCFSYAHGACDHQAYMPLPLPVNCSSNPVKGIRYVANQIPRTNEYFVASIYGCNTTYDYFNDNSSGSGQLIYNQPVQLTDFSLPSDSLVVSSATNPLLVTRQGRSGLGGSYLLGIPPADQYVTGTVLFFAFGMNSTLQVVATEFFDGQAFLDGQPYTGNWTTFPGAFGVLLTSFAIAPGQHTFSLNGMFIIEVYGSNSGMSSYGYLPAMNAPNYGTITTATTPAITATTATAQSTATATTAQPSSSFDSEGTEFWTAFILNKTPGRTNTNASLTFVNRNVFSVSVNITYNNVTASTKITDFVTVPAISTLTRYFPQDSLDVTNYAVEDGFDFVLPSSFRVQSSAPISVIATSTSLDGSSGDSYLVLPTTLLQTTYVVAGADQVAPTNYNSRNVAYFIATQDNTEFYVTILKNGTFYTGYQVLNAGGMCAFVSANAYAVVMTTTKPIAVVVGADCFSYANGACDHQAYMPQALPTNCTRDYEGVNYVANQLPRTNSYFVASVYGCNVTYHYSSENGSGSGQLTTSQPVQYSDFSLPTESFYIYAAFNPLLVTRQGRNGIGGSYLLDVPTAHQYVTGSVMFVAFGMNSILQVVAIDLGSAFIDGQPYTGNWTILPSTAGFRLTSVAITPGQHTFSLNVPFLIEIYGSNSEMSSYGYLPAMNALSYEKTTTTTTPITTVTTATAQSTATATTATPFSTTTTQPSYSIDSEGTDFWTAFILNKTPGRTNTNASLTFINKNAFSVNVNLTYNNVTASTKITDVVTVLAISTITRFFPQDSLDNINYSDPNEDGFDFVYQSSFHVQSSSPISVVATSTSLDGSSGDSFLVLPTTLLQTTYVVAGADQVNPRNFNSTNVVYFIATQDFTQFYATILRNGTISQGFEEFDAGGMCAFVSSSAYTVIMTATKPIAVVVGTDCYSYADGLCDHQAYMPQPLLVNCSSIDLVDEVHYVANQIPRMNEYYVASVYGCNTTYEYFNDNCPTSCGMDQLTYNQPVKLTNFSLPSDSFVITSQTNPLLLTRQGRNGLSGSYLLGIPSDDQFVSGTVMFFAFGFNSTLQVVASRFFDGEGGQAFLDGQPYVGNWTNFPGTFGVMLTSAAIAPGQHSFFLNGLFIIEVYGSISGLSSYGYLPAINAPNYEKTTVTIPITTVTTATAQSTATATTATSFATTTAEPSSFFDSEGTDFWTAFVLNKTPGRTNTNASLTFINRNVFSVSVNVTYNNVTAFTKVTDFVIVSAISTITRYFPQDSLDVTNYAVEDGFDFVLPSSFRVQSSAPISVVAMSTSLDGSSGDSYLVLPTTLLQTTYVVAGADQVAPTNYNSRNVAYFIATQDNTEFYATILKNGTIYTGYQALNAGGMCAFVSANAYTVVMTSTKPIAVVVGADCFSYAPGACDHQAYMPQALPVNCIRDYDGNHAVANLIPRTNSYIVASVYGCNVTYFYSSVNGSGSGQLTASQPVQYTDFSIPTESFYLYSDTNPLLLTRQGRNGLGGSYLLDAPTTSQYVTGSVMFIAFGLNSSLQVVILDLFDAEPFLDGQPYAGSWTTFHGEFEFYMTTAAITPGQHTFSCNVPFLIEVYGSNSGMSSYGYLPAMNAPNYEKTTIATIPTTASATTATSLTTKTTAAITSQSTASPATTTTTLMTPATSSATSTTTISPSTTTITISLSTASTTSLATSTTVVAASSTSLSTTATSPSSASTTTAIPTNLPGAFNSTVTVAINLTMGQVVAYEIPVNTSAGVTFGMAESSGRLLVYVSRNCAAIQGTPLLNTSETSTSAIFLNESAINNLFACQASDVIADQLAFKHFVYDQSSIGDVTFDQSIISIFASIQGANNNSNAGTLTVGTGDIYYRAPEGQPVKTAELSDAEIVLIVLGSVFIGAIALGVAVCIYRSKKKQQKRSYDLVAERRKEEYAEVE